MIITIDGPAVSGKSTVAELLAKKLGYYYLYSGLLFRAAAYLLHTHAGYDLDTLQDIAEKDLELYLDPERLEYSYSPTKGARVFFDEIDITQKLHGVFMGQLASVIATSASVRAFLKEMQYKIADKKNIVVDGRDSGTAVFSDADYKFYLTASLLVRAHRLQEALHKKGKEITVDDAMHEIETRDNRDVQRAVAPLMVADSAITIDNSKLSRHDTMQEFLNYLQID